MFLTLLLGMGDGTVSVGRNKAILTKITYVCLLAQQFCILDMTSKNIQAKNAKRCLNNIVFHNVTRKSKILGTPRTG